MIEKIEGRRPAWTRVPFQHFLLALGLIAVGGLFQAASAATLCVNPQGTKGCFNTIQAAVNAAKASDAITVAPGVYREDVTIKTPIALVGANAGNTIIDAQSMANGIYVDGLDNSGMGKIGLSGVVITGFTVENAEDEGILVTNANDVTVSSNVVMNNDQTLHSKNGCQGLPSWELAESEDCGEGIHISGVRHSIVSNNVVESNAGGILLADDTGATRDNLITGNTVRNNPYDCGITLASHPNVAGAPPYGVSDNTISGNLSAHNGDADQGGAGVGIFDSVPHAKANGNRVIHNRLIGNSLPGVAMHSHAPNQQMRNTVILGNYIAFNGADTGQTETPGPAGINLFGVSPELGTVISQNVIKGESIGIAVNTPAPVYVHLNNFSVSEFGVDNLGTAGTIDATENWWGCSEGPSAEGCSSIGGTNVFSMPYLIQQFQPER